MIYWYCLPARLLNLTRRIGTMAGVIKARKAEGQNCDVILMFKIQILQQWYGLSDLEVERQMDDRISYEEVH
jgi:hypothetical protein